MATSRTYRRSISSSRSRWCSKRNTGGGDATRLLEPVRQFAQAQLAASGVEDVVRRRHAAYFLWLAEQMYHARDTSNEGEWLGRLEPERDNLRAVNRWAIEHGEAELAQRFNGWLFAFWIYRSSKAEARRWTDAALALTAPTPSPEALTAERAGARHRRVSGLGFQREYRYAQGCFQRELEIYTQMATSQGSHEPVVGWALSRCTKAIWSELRR